MFPKGISLNYLLPNNFLLFEYNGKLITSMGVC